MSELLELQRAIALRNGERHITITDEQRARAIARRQARLLVPESPMACVALATLTPAQKNGAQRDHEGPREVDGIRGDWLDEDGFVLPEYRERAAEARMRHRREMSPIGEVMVAAQSRANYV
jgi:hypothetical protein